MTNGYSSSFIESLDLQAMSGMLIVCLRKHFS